MKHAILATLGITLSFITTGCGSGGGGSTTRELGAGLVPGLAWSGTYSTASGPSGTINVQIRSMGQVRGTARDTTTGRQFIVTGDLEPGPWHMDLLLTAVDAPAAGPVVEAHDYVDFNDVNRITGHLTRFPGPGIVELDIRRQ